MPVKPQLPHYKPDTVPARFRSPEEEELDRKGIELEQALSELADSELELATLRSELLAFERGYMDVVGRRYAELDRLEAEIAECRARGNPQDKSAREAAGAARVRARESAEALGTAAADRPAPDFKPSEELKNLYRQAAREVHPDLAPNEHELPRRARAMAELNRAYEEGDEARIRQILAEWRSSPEQVHGDDTAAQLVRVIREIAQARKRIAAIKGEIEELGRGELSRLKRQVEEAATRGQDLLGKIAKELDARVAETWARLRQASSAQACP
jgi:DNA repair exonuclease SbcCD ATPase subunit